MKALLAAVAAVQAWYWLAYFPRAWRGRSNAEIDALRIVADVLRGRPPKDAVAHLTDDVRS